MLPHVAHRPTLERMLKELQRSRILARLSSKDCEVVVAGCVVGAQPQHPPIGRGRLRIPTSLRLRVRQVVQHVWVCRRQAHRRRIAEEHLLLPSRQQDAQIGVCCRRLLRLDTDRQLVRMLRLRHGATLVESEGPREVRPRHEER